MILICAELTHQTNKTNGVYTPLIILSIEFLMLAIPQNFAGLIYSCFCFLLRVIAPVSQTGWLGAWDRIDYSVKYSFPFPTLFD